MRGIVGMLPWVIVLAIAGAAVWLLLDRQVVLGTWILAALILGHGLVHALFLLQPPDPPAGRPGPRWVQLTVRDSCGPHASRPRSSAHVDTHGRLR